MHEKYHYTDQQQQQNDKFEIIKIDYITGTCFIYHECYILEIDDHL